MLQQSEQRLDESENDRQGLEESHAESGVRIRSLENELDGLRTYFDSMENTYRKKIREAEDVVESYEKKLGLVSRELEKKDNEVEDLEAAMELLIHENDELKDLNQSILGESHSLETLREKLDKANRQLDRAKHQKSQVQKETTSLLDKKERLLKESQEVSVVHSEQVRESERLKGEGMSASKKLDATLEQLRESEKRVAYLRNLELELEKSVLRAQRSALSRKGIYSENEEELTTIWPETEQVICKELIDRLELLEDLMARYQQSWFFPKIAEQLNLLRDSFMGLLRNHSVDQFNLEPGTELSVESRKKIQLISVDDLDDSRLKRKSAQKAEDAKRTTVVETLRPGYIYSKGGEDVIIRKAEVIVA